MTSRPFNGNRFTKIHQANAGKRLVVVVPDLGFGPYAVGASTDKAAAEYAVLENLRPLRKAGAIREKCWAVCGKEKVAVR